MADMDEYIEQLLAEMPEPAQKIVRNIKDEPIPGAVKQRLLRPLLPGKPRPSRQPRMRKDPPRVLNFPACRDPGGSILTGNVASLVSSNCSLWEERRGNTTRLPWVATRKPEEGTLEIGSLVSPDCSTRLFGLDFGVEGCP